MLLSILYLRLLFWHLILPVLLILLLLDFALSVLFAGHLTLCLLFDHELAGLQGWPGFPGLTHWPSHSSWTPNPELELVPQSCQFCSCVWGTRAHANWLYQAESYRLVEEEKGAIVFLLWKVQSLQCHLSIMMESPVTTTARSAERIPAPSCTSQVSSTLFLSFQSLTLFSQPWEIPEWQLTSWTTTLPSSSSFLYCLYSTLYTSAPLTEALSTLKL